MSTREALVKQHNSHHTKVSNSKTTSHSRSCGDFENKMAHVSEPVRATSSQHSSRLEEALSSLYSGSGEYYKRYDYDDMPLRDDAVTSQTSTDSGKGEKIPLTDSHLQTLENNISQDLKTDSSYNTLDSSIKFFKVTVEEIFSKFYTNMQDFELYKNRFHEILAKDQEQCIDEMEGFIKDMIHHIMSSESTDFNTNCLCDLKNKEPVARSTPNINPKIDDIECIMEAFKNDNFPTLSTSFDRDSSESKQEWKNKFNSSETFNIYLMSQNPYVKIERNKNRRHLSEIKIMKRSRNEALGKAPASADNISLAIKEFQLANLDSPPDTGDFTDQEIPVKISFAKKNIHSDEEVQHKSHRTEKSFIEKLCSYLCAKIRKAANMGM